MMARTRSLPEPNRLMVAMCFLMHRRVYRLYQTLTVKPNHKIAFPKSCSGANPPGGDRKIGCQVECKNDTENIQINIGIKTYLETST